MYVSTIMWYKLFRNQKCEIEEEKWNLALQAIEIKSTKYKIHNPILFFCSAKLNLDFVFIYHYPIGYWVIWSQLELQESLVQSPDQH